MKPVRLMTQNMTDPIGLECKKPRFSYLLPLERRGERQTAYQILAASRKELLEEGTADLWDSGKIAEERNYGISYDGKPLGCRQEVFWKVRIWDERDTVSAWSDHAHRICAFPQVGRDIISHIIDAPVKLALSRFKQILRNRRTVYAGFKKTKTADIKPAFFHRFPFPDEKLSSESRCGGLVPLKIISQPDPAGLPVRL